MPIASTCAAAGAGAGFGAEAEELQTKRSETG